MRRWPRCWCWRLFVPSAGAGAPFTWTLLGLNGASSLALLSPILYAGVAPIFGPFVAGAIVAGMALAVGLHAWNSRHPTAVACTRRIYSKDPEINISSVPVGGNIGGFLFVAASSLTILIGLPELRWFVLGAMVGGARWRGACSPGGVRTTPRPLQPSSCTDDEPPGPTRGQWPST